MRPRSFPRGIWEKSIKLLGNFSLAEKHETVRASSRVRSARFVRDETDLSTRLILQWRINHGAIIYLSGGPVKRTRRRHLCTPPKARRVASRGTRGCARGKIARGRMTNWTHGCPIQWKLRLLTFHLLTMRKLLISRDYEPRVRVFRPLPLLEDPLADGNVRTFLREREYEIDACVFCFM